MRYRRDILDRFSALWFTGGLLIAAIRSHLSPIPWDNIINVYLIAGFFVIVVYGEFRRRWPYPFKSNEALLEIARESYFQDNIQHALRTLRELLATDPRNVEARYLIGKILNEQSNPQKAMRYLNFAHEIDPNSIGILVEVGISFELLDRYQNALDVFQQVLVKEPTNDYAAQQIEICKQKLGSISTS
jgi:tetratricopeptide (TPR) repeat protein